MSPLLIARTYRAIRIFNLFYFVSWPSKKIAQQLTGTHPSLNETALICGTYFRGG